LKGAIFWGLLVMDSSKNDIIKNMQISLEKAHVEGVPEYIKRLQNNSSNCGVFQDLLLEGRAALMFKQADCGVTIQESPDLACKFNNEQFYAEVKHFREKPQDIIDVAKMSGLGDEDELMPYGDTVPLEGKPAWEQVYDVAKKKIKQYKSHAPNILVIESSSACIEDTEIPSVIDMINKDVHSGKYSGFAKLNGILLALDWYNISQKWRKVFFYSTGYHAVPLSRELSLLLDNILLG
jgi:hypothetical protein